MGQFESPNFPPNCTGGGGGFGGFPGSFAATPNYDMAPDMKLAWDKWHDALGQELGQRWREAIGSKWKEHKPLFVSL